ncbi:MAG: hypothetical protein ABIG11_01555 [bacterium]
MKIILSVGLAVFFAGPSMAYVSVDCDVNVTVENRITSLDMDQQIGAERIECAEAEARVVRMVKTAVSVQAYAEARARGSASAYYSDSCSCHCQGGSCSCSTSGSGSDSCSDSGDDSARQNKTAETKFTVARASLDSLYQSGFSVLQGPDYCRLADTDGLPLNTINAVSIITWVYGVELMKETADFKVRKKLRMTGQPSLPDSDYRLPEIFTFDGNGGQLK